MQCVSHLELILNKETTAAEASEEEISKLRKENMFLKHRFEQIQASHKEIEKGFAEERLKFEQELAKTREEYEKVKSELELTKEANDSLTKMGKIILNKNEEKKVPKGQPEDDIEAQVLKEEIVTI